MYKTKFWTIVFVIAIPLFLMARSIWPFHYGTPNDVQSFFNIVTLIESIFSGIGVAFLITVLSDYKVKVRTWGLFDWFVFISVVWILISGYPHDNSHIASEAHAINLIKIEIFFHGSLALAALAVMHDFMRKLKR